MRQVQLALAAIPSCRQSSHCRAVAEKVERCRHERSGITALTVSLFPVDLPQSLETLRGIDFMLL